MVRQDADEDDCTLIFSRSVVFAVSSASADARHRYVALTVPAFADETSCVTPLPTTTRISAALLIFSSLAVIAAALNLALHAPR
jgi:hypothetical protein